MTVWRDDPAGLRIGGIYALCTAGLLAVPLVNTMHAEAGAVIAVLAFFLSGWFAVGAFSSGRRAYTRELLFHSALLLVPFGLYQVPRLWTVGCDFAAGVLFYLLFPVVSVVFAVSLAWLLTGFRLRRGRLIFVLCGFALITLPVLFDLAFHPQFYVYNHVFGGVLGPIYDLELAVRPGLFWFRALTILWAAVAVIVGFRVRGIRRRWQIPAVGSLLAVILLFYVFAGRLGFNTTYSTLEEALGAVRQTRHFEIHYDPQLVSDVRIGQIAQDHEFRYAQMVGRLGFAPADRIHSFLYSTPAIRAILTGAGYTNIAPVWLGRPQVHIVLDSYDRSFTHELAHVFSREIGLPIINTSMRVGLIEGFAVAIEPPDGLPGPDEQVAAVLQDSAAGYLDRESLAAAVSKTMSAAGFWTGRGAVSYTTMGSFVAFLISEFGIDSFRRVYGMEGFESAYGMPVRALAERWVDSLANMDVRPGVLDLAAARFSVLSLFERRCPHDIPPALCSYREAESSLIRGDTADAIVRLETALADAPAFDAALQRWAELQMRSGSVERVAARLTPVWDSLRTEISPAVGLNLGDALAASGRSEAASIVYRQVLELTPRFARSLRAMAQVGLTAVEADTNSLNADSSGALLILTALDAAETEDYGRAADLLVSAEGSEAASLIGERFYSWLAGFAFYAGRLNDAERFRRMAVETSSEDGDRHQVERLRDFGERIAWSQNADSGADSR